MLAPSKSDFAKLSSLRAGDSILIDMDMECLDDNRAALFSDPFGALYFPCRCGHHYVAQQLATDGDTLIGVYLCD